MKKLILNSLAVVLLIMAIGLSGCQDFDVANQNNPDEERALATPSDVESLVQGAYQSYFDAIESGSPNMSLAVLSDAYTCSWGNYGMSIFAREPREEITNETGSRANTLIP